MVQKGMAGADDEVTLFSRLKFLPFLTNTYFQRFLGFDRENLTLKY